MVKQIRDINLAVCKFGHVVCNINKILGTIFCGRTFLISEDKLTIPEYSLDNDSDKQKT